MTTYTLTYPVEVNVLVGWSITATLEVNVGAPYQGDIRSLAADRWYSMYPS